MDLKNQTQKRTIKFRAICAFSGVWRYGFYYVSKGNHIIRDENDKESIVLEKTLGQFTGLHDKNGKEIYEGDWCCAKFMTKNDNKVIQGLIIMDEFMWCIDCTGNLGDDIFSINRIHDVEVIGNIFDDPELVKL